MGEMHPYHLPFMFRGGGRESRAKAVMSALLSDQIFSRHPFLFAMDNLCHSVTGGKGMSRGDLKELVLKDSHLFFSLSSILAKIFFFTLIDFYEYEIVIRHVLAISTPSGQKTCCETTVSHLVSCCCCFFVFFAVFIFKKEEIKHCLQNKTCLEHKIKVQN